VRIPRSKVESWVEFQVHVEECKWQDTDLIIILS